MAPSLFVKEIKIVSHVDITDAHAKNKMSVLIGLEGGHMINSNLAMLRLYYELGVRYMTLTHSCHTPW